MPPGSFPVVGGSDVRLQRGQYGLMASHWSERPLAGALIAVLGQEFHLWREHRRRFDQTRHVAYSNLIREAFRTHNAFAMTLVASCAGLRPNAVCTTAGRRRGGGRGSAPPGI